MAHDEIYDGETPMGAEYEDDGQPDDLTENEDFAHDGDFDNMYATEDGFYSNEPPEEWG